MACCFLLPYCVCGSELVLDIGNKFQSQIMGIYDQVRRLSGVKVICLKWGGAAPPSNGVSWSHLCFKNVYLFVYSYFTHIQGITLNIEICYYTAYVIN